MGYAEEIIKVLEENKDCGKRCGLTIPSVLDDVYDILAWEIVDEPQGDYVGEGVWIDLDCEDVFNLLAGKGNVYIKKMDGKILKLYIIGAGNHEARCE